MDKGSPSSLVSHKAYIKPQGEKTVGGINKGAGGGQIKVKRTEN